jgi:hypothetical protein
MPDKRQLRCRRCPTMSSRRSRGCCPSSLRMSPWALPRSPPRRWRHDLASGRLGRELSCRQRTLNFGDELRRLRAKIDQR